MLQSSRVASDPARKLSKSHGSGPGGSGPVGSGQDVFEESRVEPGQVNGGVGISRVGRVGSDPVRKF